MQLGSTIGTACLTFAITNIDDAFVLVTFFAESSTSKNLTPLKITLGQYTGFTVIMVVSLIGFAVAAAIPSEPIGFLGLLPILLGVWRLFGLLFPKKDDTEEEQPESKRIANAKSVLKVASITIMNGGIISAPIYHSSLKPRVQRSPSTPWSTIFSSVSGALSPFLS